MSNAIIIKEIENILKRVSEDEKEEILDLSRRVMTKSLCNEGLKADADLRAKSREELEKLPLQGKMSIRASDFEKSVTMLKLIAEKMDFGKKFRMVLEYDPELLSATLEYYWD